MDNKTFHKLANPGNIVIDKTKLYSYIEPEKTYREKEINRLQNSIDTVETLKAHTRRIRILKLYKELRELNGGDFSLENYPVNGYYSKD